MLRATSAGNYAKSTIIGLLRLVGKYPVIGSTVIPEHHCRSKPEKGKQSSIDSKNYPKCSFHDQNVNKVWLFTIIRCKGSYR